MMAQTLKTPKKNAVVNVAFRHLEDFGARGTKVVSGAKLDELISLCVTRAVSALERDVSSYASRQRDQISDVFKSLLSTHRTIRKLLKEYAHDNPEAVDALSLLRLQLEGLFVACLMLEAPKYVDLYVGDYWKKTYIDYLLIKEESGALPSQQDYLATSLPNIINLRNYFGLTEEHQATIELEQLGTPIPVGLTNQPIPWFPTPGDMPKEIVNADKKRMLERLKFRYDQLCSFSHVLGHANLLKAVFDKRFVHRNDGRIREEDVKEKFQGVVVIPATLDGCLCITQAATELTMLYPNDLDLAAIAKETWNAIADRSSLCHIVWALRAKKMLGIV